MVLIGIERYDLVNDRCAVVDDAPVLRGFFGGRPCDLYSWEYQTISSKIYRSIRVVWLHLYGDNGRHNKR
jgi:hypothetical protein